MFDNGDGVGVRVGSLRIIKTKLVDGNYLSLVWKLHCSEHRGSYCCHGVKPITTKKYVIIKSGIDDFYMNGNHLAPQRDCQGWDQAIWLKASSIRGLKCCGGLSDFGGANGSPTSQRHNRGRCSFIQDGTMDVLPAYRSVDLKCELMGE